MEQDLGKEKTGNLDGPGISKDERAFYFEVYKDDDSGMLQKGDSVLVEPEKEINNGDMVLAYINSRVGLYHYYKEGEEITLKPLRASCKVRTFRVLAKPHGIWRIVGFYRPFPV
jgi:SOS-response transcriptional repressor LexA